MTCRIAKKKKPKTKHTKWEKGSGSGWRWVVVVYKKEGRDSMANREREGERSDRERAQIEWC
jgi:hypothetical protein